MLNPEEFFKNRHLSNEKTLISLDWGKGLGKTWCHGGHGRRRCYWMSNLWET